MDVEIKRKEIIIVDSVSKNSYGDLIFSDKSGKEYKISNKRVQYFENVIQPNMGVELHYAISSFGKEYIYSAIQVKDTLPPVNPLVEAAKKMGTVPIDKIRVDGFKPQTDTPQSKSSPIKPQSNTSIPLSPKNAPQSHQESEQDYWDKKNKATAKSIERQKSLELSITLAKRDGDLTQIITTAKRFEKYLETGE